ncbi:unnamed protein product [marine sediment metagenome]|uniref:Uncharacterized protein n=1 Tax=marine sediment metagenome TaxID=412755 RepID=X0RZZ6_9ZZZZ
MKNQFRKRLYSEVSPAIFDTKGRVKWVCGCGSFKYFRVSTKAVLCGCGKMMKEKSNESD